MIRKALLYTVNNGESVNEGGTIPIGFTVRKFGKQISKNGDGILTCREGYYTFAASLNVVSPSASTITIQAFEDGAPIPGAIATATVAAGATVFLGMDFVTRNKCCDSSKTITLKLISGNSTSISTAVKCVKL